MPLKLVIWEAQSGQHNNPIIQLIMLNWLNNLTLNYTTLTCGLWGRPVQSPWILITYSLSSCVVVYLYCQGFNRAAHNPKFLGFVWPCLHLDLEHCFQPLAQSCYSVTLWCYAVLHCCIKSCYSVTTKVRLHWWRIRSAPSVIHVM